MSQPFPLDPYFSGNYTPISIEADAFDLPLRGELPKDLAGTLYRNGPNPQFAPRDSSHHWFIGDGMIHAFHVADGRVSYRNRWVRTPKWELEHKAHLAVISFAASFAVLVFEPHTTMPPSNNETAAAISPRSNRMTPTSIAAKTSPPPATAMREAKMNLRQLPISVASSSMRSSRRTIASWGSALPTGF
jgi:Retinal pigment epithelial membrane protein